MFQSKAIILIIVSIFVVIKCDNSHSNTAAKTTNYHKVKEREKKNKAGYTATPFACGWAGAVIEVTRSFGLEK